MSQSHSRRTRLGVDRLEDRAVPATFVVNTAEDLLDTVDDGVIDVDPNTPGEQISLRQAILLSNETPEVNTVTFDLPAGTRLGIDDTDLNALPTSTNQIIIDGGTKGSESLVISNEGDAVFGLTFDAPAVVRDLTVENFELVQIRVLDEAGELTLVDVKTSGGPTGVESLDGLVLGNFTATGHETGVITNNATVLPDARVELTQNTDAGLRLTSGFPITTPTFTMPADGSGLLSLTENGFGFAGLGGSKATFTNVTATGNTEAGIRADNDTEFTFLGDVNLSGNPGAGLVSTGLVTIEGTLTANGNTGTGVRGDAIRLEENASLTANQNKGNGISANRLTAGGEVEARNNALSGIVIDTIAMRAGGSIVADDNGVDGLQLTGPGGVESPGVETEIGPMSFSGNGRDGVRRESDGDAVRLIRSTADDNGGDGINIVGELSLGSGNHSASANKGVGIRTDGERLLLTRDTGGLVRVNGNGAEGIRTTAEEVFASRLEANENGEGGVLIDGERGEGQFTAVRVEANENRGTGINSSAPIRLDSLEVIENRTVGIIASNLVLEDEAQLTSVANGGTGIFLTGGFASNIESIGTPGGIDVRLNGGDGIHSRGVGFVELIRPILRDNGGNGIFTQGLLVVRGTSQIIGNGESGISAEASVRFLDPDDNALGHLVSENKGDGVVIENGSLLDGDSLIAVANGGTGLVVTGGDANLIESVICDNGVEETAVSGTLTAVESVIGCEPLVTNTNDDGEGSLRNAVRAAGNFFGTLDDITFDLGPGEHIITLQSPLEIAHDVTIRGPGAEVLTITGSGNHRLMTLTEFDPVFLGETNVRLFDLTLAGGDAPGGNGGAISAEGADLELFRVHLRDNTAGLGGAIYSVGVEIEVDDPYGGYGGYGGGGTEINPARLFISESVFEGNTAATGGAVFSDSEFDGIRETSFHDNNGVGGDGGAIFYSGEGQLPISSSTFSANEASGEGGAIHTSGALDVSNSTISGNSAFEGGGGIFFDGATGSSLFHVTVTDNTSSNGAGLSVGFGGDVEVDNTIVALNNGLDIFGNLDSGSENNLIGEDPLLEPLADNGGPTRTHALRPDSPAIDQLSVANPTASADQRGFLRDVLRQSPTRDIGAYERLIDFGNAPLGFPVSLEEDGARHQVNGLFLGNIVRGELDGGFLLRGAEDDDGVDFRIAGIGFQSIVEVTASADGFVSAWIDFNEDFDWDDPGEQILTDVAVTAGVNRLTYTVPDTVPGSLVTFARVRVSSETGLQPTGFAPDGEVEDYTLILEEPVLPEDVATTPTGAPQFRFAEIPVTRGLIRIIDPDIAIGYVYEVEAGPGFESVEFLPGFGDDVFTVEPGDGQGGFGAPVTITAGEVLNFAAGGISRFRVTGIEADENLDPENPLAFPAAIGFADDGQVLMTQTPLVTPTAGDDEAATDNVTILEVDAPGVLGNDTDPDEGDILTVTAINGETAAVGTEIVLPSGARLTLRPDGGFTYDPTGAFDDLVPGESVTDTFEYTVTDLFGGFDQGTVSITVTPVNTAPTIAIEGAPEEIAEGTPVRLTAEVLDPDADDTVVVNWVVTKDGEAFATGNGVNFTFTPDDNAEYAVTATATDEAGASATDGAIITAFNVAPTATILGVPNRVSINVPVTLTADIDEPGIADTVDIEWAVTKDGAAFAAGTGDEFTFTPDGPGVFVVTLTATDDDNGVGTDVVTIEVADNPAEVVLENTVDELPEGTVGPVKVADVVATDDPGETPVVTLGGEDAGLFELVGTELFLKEGVTLDFEAQSSFDVTVSADDPDVGGTPDDTAERSITVTNVAPAVTADQATVAGTEGDTVATTGMYFEPGENAVTLTASIGTVVDNGDGTWAWTLDTTDSDKSGTVTITATDGAGESSEVTFDLDIANAAPEITEVTLPEEANVGGTVTVTGAFIDAGVTDTHAATVDWGNGTVTEAVVDPDARTFTAEHAYTASGTFTVTITVTDDDGGVATQTETITAVGSDNPAEVELENAVAELAEGTVGPVKVADVVATDDPGETPVITLGGEDAGLFELIGTELFLRAGVTLDFEANPSLDVTVRADDPDVGGTPDDTAALSVRVTNVAPEVAADQAAADGTEGGTVANTGTYTEPGENAVTLTASVGTVVDNGDGTWAWTLDTTDSDKSGTVTITATDGAGESSEVTFDLDIANAAPEITDLSSDAGEADDVFAGETVTVTGTFIDAGVTDTHTVTVDWGDGTVSDATVNAGDRSFVGQHAYAEGGVYDVSVTVTDDDGGTVSAETTTLIVGVSLRDGVVTVVGTGGRDNITAEPKGGQLRVRLRAADGTTIAHEFALSEVAGLAVLARDGDDFVALSKRLTLGTAIDGGDGHDVIFGGGGDDAINGGNGSDLIFARGGNDFVIGGAGRDLVFAGDGHDTVRGGDGHDTLFGGSGDDLLAGDDGDDLLFGQSGNDSLYGGDGEDTLFGGRGHDYLNGGPGSDWLLW